MKKRLITMVLAATFTLSTFAVKAHADGVTTSLTPQAGITPDSILYPLDKLIDEIKISLSFSDGSKVETLIKIAQERLGESQVMTEKDKLEDAQKALEEYKELLEKAGIQLDKVIEASSTSDDEQKAEEAKELEEKVQEEQNTSTTVLSDMKDTVKDTDIEKSLSQVLEMQQAKKEAVRAMVDAQHQLNAARKAYNMARVALKKVEKSGNQEAIKAAQDALKTAQEAYTKEQKEYSEAFANKQAVVQKYAGMNISDVEEDKDDEQATAVDGTTSATATTTSTTTLQTSTVKSTEVNEKDDKKVEASEKVKGYEKNKDSVKGNENHGSKGQGKGKNK